MRARIARIQVKMAVEDCVPNSKINSLAPEPSASACFKIDAEFMRLRSGFTNSCY